MSEKAGSMVFPPLTERDRLASWCLGAIYQNQTMLTDVAARLAYEQADELLKARISSQAKESAEHTRPYVGIAWGSDEV